MIRRGHDHDPLWAPVAGMRARPDGAGAASERLAATLAPGMKTSKKTCKENLVPIKGFHG